MKTSSYFLFLLFSLCFWHLNSSSLQAKTSLVESMSTKKFKSWSSFDFIKDPVMNDQFRWVLSQMHFGQADLGESLSVAQKIKSGDQYSWVLEWTKMAKRLRKEAIKREGEGRRESAAKAYYRAATYYRASLLHFSHFHDPLMRENTLLSLECFRKGNQLSDVPVTEVGIPYEGKKLLAYFYRSPHAKEVAPLLIVHQGRDGWPEDTRWVYEGALKRGIHCLMVHAPGQGAALRLEGLTFRPDWEKVITPIVDFALTLPGVDRDRLILMGLSFGGALVPRALAFEKRLRLAIVDPGVLNWGESTFEHFKNIPGLTYLFHHHQELFNVVMKVMAKSSSLASWWLEDESFKQGVTSPHALFQKHLLYNNTHLVDQITTPLMILDGTEEAASPKQSQNLFEALPSSLPKYLMLFDKETTAALHCQNGALAFAQEELFDSPFFWKMLNIR